MNIRGRMVTLRAVEESDLALLHKWANDPETQDTIGIIHFPSSMDFHKRWFEDLKNDQFNQRLAIDAPSVGLVGLSSIFNIDWRNRHASHGIMIGNATNRGRGLGADAVMATMRYAFDEMHLARLDGSSIEYNTNSQTVYAKLGWKEEGRRRNYYYRRGRYWDEVINGITKEDYDEFTKRTRYWG